MPDSRQTLGFVTNQGIGNRIKPRTVRSRISGANYDIDSSLFTIINENDRIGMRDYDLNYKFDIDTNGKQLTADFNFAPYTYSQNRYGETNYYNNAGQLSHSPTFQNSTLPTRIDIFAGKVDYTHPVSKNTKLETGIKGSYVSSDNNAHYWSTIQGITVTDTTLTNHFIYTENIYSGYVNWIQKINKKIDVQLGFRGEKTQAQGKQMIHDVSFTRNYFNLFPSIFINWRIDSSHTLNLSYSRRIDRPDYTEMNPFRFYNDKYNYTSGNPYLLPQLSDNFEITHIYKEFLSTSLGYLHMTNATTQIAHQDDSTHVTNHVLENLSTYNCINVLVAATIPITKWLTSITSVNTFYDHYYGPVLGGNYSGKYLTSFISSQNIITLKKDWGAEISFFYRTVNMDGLQLQDPISSLDIGIRKRFADGKGSVSLNASDIFWTSYQNQHTIYQNVNSEIKGHNDSRRVRLSVSWKFGSSQYQRDEKKKGAEEELKRAGGG